MSNVLGDLPRENNSDGEETLRYIGDMKFSYENDKLVKRFEVNPPEVAAGAEGRDDLLDTIVVEIEPKDSDTIEKSLKQISNSEEKPVGQAEIESLQKENDDDPQTFEVRIDLRESHGVVVTSEVTIENQIIGLITDTLTRYNHANHGFDGDIKYLAEKQFAKMVGDVDPDEMKAKANNDR